MTKGKQRRNPNAIKKIIDIKYDGFVYDLTTENHHFAAGIGNMIVHNTDSVFFTFNLQTLEGKPIRGKEALEITIELARESLADKIRASEEAASVAPRPMPSVDRVQEIVSRRWGVTPEGLRSKARIQTLTVPRQIAMYLAREVLHMQLVEIGQAFGGRDHSTVIHSVDKVERQMARDRAFRERVELARQELFAQ